jgi:hypothetical protein
MLIIFYGVFSAFADAVPYIFPQLELFWIIIISLLVAAALLFLYSHIILNNITVKMTKTVFDLEQIIRGKEEELKKKEAELHNAFKVKKAVEYQAEETL